MMPPERPAEPWLSLLTDLDTALEAPADFHCIGGFVVSQCYGFARETADLDVLTVIPREAGEQVAQFAGKGSALHKKHRVYMLESRTTRRATTAAWSAHSRYGRRSGSGLSIPTISP
jgi:hypothetical protein